jgi:hypothetical protein
LFFEALVADNLDLGRTEQLEFILGKKILPSTAGVFDTRVVSRGVDVCLQCRLQTVPHQAVLQIATRGRTLRV